MKDLIDNDAFCKLGASGLLERMLSLFRCPKSDARRLASLPHMLKRGRIARQLGQERSAIVASLAATIDPAPEPSTTWPQRILDARAQIDPGEAQLFALAAENPGVLLVTGDKTALRDVHRVDGLSEALKGRVVTIEAALLALAKTNADEVSAAVRRVLDLDSALRACFSSDPYVDGLRSYQADLAAKVAAGILWEPP